MADCKFRQRWTAGGTAMISAKGRTNGTWRTGRHAAAEQLTGSLFGRERGYSFRRYAMMRCLFVSVGKLYQLGLAVGPSEESDAGGQPLRGEAGWNRDRRGVDKKRG